MTPPTAPTPRTDALLAQFSTGIYQIRHNEIPETRDEALIKHARTLERELSALKQREGVLRRLLESDSYCPSCGHNRDTSSVSTIDNGDGTKTCQLCAIRWVEITTETAVRGIGHLDVPCVMHLMIECERCYPPKPKAAPQERCCCAGYSTATGYCPVHMPAPASAAPLQTDEQGRPMTYWGGQPKTAPQLSTAEIRTAPSQEEAGHVGGSGAVPFPPMPPPPFPFPPMPPAFPAGAAPMPEEPYWWWASGSVARHSPDLEYQVVGKRDYDTLRARCEELAGERDALAAAMPSEGADAALAYAAMKTERDLMAAAVMDADEQDWYMPFAQTEWRKKHAAAIAAAERVK